MGKSKKTRWRTFEISESQDETTTNGDVKVNGTDSQAPVTSQKYSQILGDIQANNAHQFSRNSSSHNIYKSRAYNNKENFFNQRGRPGAQRSWQRGSNYRTPFANEKDKNSEQSDKAGSGDAKVNSSTEPLKFNEDEYTRITTPRQDVLFKKGYLSRMTNKTATNLSATVNSTESTAASSTVTTSDPDSSVSTLSPATTPSMDYGQMDSMDFPPMYYPGYYDENGMLVIPMYNGYNYYPPNGSSATSPVYLMPYPYQYDPFFMTPSGMQPVDDEETAEDKTEADDAKENNQLDENQNGARTSSSSSDDGADNGRNDAKKEEDKKESNELNGQCDETESNNPDLKQSFPVFPNEFMLQAYQNGYYNNFCYYNGAPSSRPPKFKRRKRFLNTRNSQHQQPRSAETTTDYSDDEATPNTRRFNPPRYQNGWTYPNAYNHFNGKFQRFHLDQNDNQTQNGFHLNVDVQEFYPRAQTNGNEQVNSIESVEKPSTPPKVEAPKVTKTSQPAKPPGSRVSKKEIIDGIKSMEQQNIDLTKHHATANANHVDEWNVIKNGKKVKVAKDIKMELSSSDVQDAKPEKVEEIKIEEPKAEVVIVPEAVKKSAPAPSKSKKSKNKGKKKKPHLLTKQGGFEITEPEFNRAPTAEAAEQDVSDEDTTVESDIPIAEPETVENAVLSNLEEKIEPVEEKTVSQEVNDLPGVFKLNDNEDDDAVIDISDEDISGQIKIPLELSSIPKTELAALVESIEKPKELKVEHEEDKVIESKADDEVKQEVQVEQEIRSKVEVQAEPETKAESVVIEPKLEVKKVSEVLSKCDVQKKPEAQLKLEIPKKKDDEVKVTPFQDMDFFNDKTNIAALERDLMENLKLLDDEIELKSPIINPLYDFPITSAVHKWLQAKQSESFDSLFHVQNFQKLSDRFEEDEDDDTASDISDKELKSETDSDYASDSHAKVNGGSPTCSTHAKVSSKCNKLIAKESFCALM